MALILITYGEDYEEGIILKFKVSEKELPEIKKYFKDYEEGLLDSDDSLFINDEEIVPYLIKEYEIYEKV